MRIFVYLLALLTGLSAAQNAEARVAAPDEISAAEAVSAIGLQANEVAAESAVYLALAAVELPARSEPIGAALPSGAIEARTLRSDRALE